MRIRIASWVVVGLVMSPGLIRAGGDPAELTPKQILDKVDDMYRLLNFKGEPTFEAVAVEGM